MTPFGNLEAVDFGESRWINITEGLGRFGGLLVPDIRDSFKEEQRQDVALPVGAINRGTAKRIDGVSTAA
jgi:hypothetical protein